MRGSPGVNGTPKCHKPGAKKPEKLIVDSTTNSQRRCPKPPRRALALVVAAGAVHVAAMVVPTAGMVVPCVVVMTVGDRRVP